MIHVHCTAQAISNEMRGGNNGGERDEKEAAWTRGSWRIYRKSWIVLCLDVTMCMESME